MVDQPITEQTYHLNANDIATLRIASELTAPSSGRRALQGILFDEGGKIVCSNAHSILVRTIESTASAKTPLILGPWHDASLPDTDQARLDIGDRGAEFTGSDGEITSLQIIDGPFVDYERVVGSQGTEPGITIDGHAFRAAVDSLSQHMEERHPTELDWQYTATVERVISPVDSLITLITRRDMGYFKTVDGEHRHLWPNGTDLSPAPAIFDWEVRASLSCDIPDGAATPKRACFHYRNLKSLVDGLVESGDIHLSFEEGRPMRISPENEPEWLGLLMPFRMAG